MVFLVENLSGSEPEAAMGEEVPQPRAAVQAPKSSLSTLSHQKPQHTPLLHKARPQGAGRGWQVDGADKQQR